MDQSAPILLRCPTCDRIGRESMIRAERFRCGCGSVLFARDPEGYGTADERRAGAARLSKFARIDLPSAHSVLLQIMSVREARKLHDTRIAQLPSLARRTAPVESPPGPAPAAPPAPEPRTADGGHDLEHEPPPEPLPRAPRPAPRPFEPRGPSPRERLRAPRVAPDVRRWYRDLAVAVGVFVVFAATGIAAKQVGRSMTAPDRQSVYVTERAVVRLDGAGRPIEIRSQDPSYVLRRYCRETGCLPFALAMPSWLPSEARLGLFRTESGVTGAIRIERATLDDWIAGGGTTAIDVYDDPPIPPRTPMVTLAR